MSIPSSPPSRPQKRAAQQPTDAELCLIGATRLQDFVDFVRQRARGGQRSVAGELADTWRQASRVYAALQTSEAGMADSVPVLELPASVQAHVEAVSQLAHFQSTFSSVPVAFGMVELDRLVVCQQHLTLSSIETLAAQYKRKPTGKALAAICLPGNEPPMAFDVVRQHGDEFVFRSNNHDARVLGTRVLTAGAIPALDLPGHAQAVVCLAVGFSSNVMNVIRYGKRLVLSNGYHRAYALRAMGVTHVPCVIQVCEHFEDVGLAVGGEMYENGEPYFTWARPPLLKDFFDKRLVHRIATLPAQRHVRVTVTSESALWAATTEHPL
jgi:hypothetical protein